MGGGPSRDYAGAAPWVSMAISLGIRAPAKEVTMSKTTRMMVYSATTEEQVLRQFAADASRAEREGFVPVAQSWDRTTLTVTYDRLASIDPSAPDTSGPKMPPAGGLGARLRHRLGHAASV